MSELLTSEACALLALDLSHTHIDGWELVQAIRANRSLTSLDVRGVPRIADLYETLGNVLAQPGYPCRIGFLRCDAFELLETATTLDLSERRVEPGAAKLLAGLLKHNRTLQHLDLTATCLEQQGLAALAAALELNASLLTLKAAHNPGLDEAAKATLRAAAERRSPPLAVELSE